MIIGRIINMALSATGGFIAANGINTSDFIQLAIGVCLCIIGISIHFLFSRFSS